MAQIDKILNKTDAKKGEGSKTLTKLIQKNEKKDKHLKREGQKGGNLTNFGCYSERREIIRRGMSF